MKLHSKHLKIQGDKAAEFVECLDKLQIDHHFLATPLYTT